MGGWGGPESVRFLAHVHVARSVVQDRKRDFLRLVIGMMLVRISSAGVWLVMRDVLHGEKA